MAAGGRPVNRLDQFLPTLNFYPNRNPKLRFVALWYFTILLIVWTFAGHLVLGFEQSYAQPMVGVAAALAAQFLLEWVDAKAKQRRPRYAGGVANFLNFLPPAIIPGLACAMLMYANSRLAPVIFAAVLSIASKVMLRAPVGNGQTQHIFNPSNLGITVTLLTMPSVGIAPPYQFTENVTGLWSWVIPALILVTGIIMHGKFTGRLPLVLAWLSGFALQGLTRAAIFGIPWRVPFVPMTSAAFILFTLYMIPDPATTPIQPRRQVLFGLAIAAIYGTLFVMHVVFGLFIALAAVSASRGIGLYLATMRNKRAPQGAAAAFAR
jgi:enediyne biosynthesis protein E5